MPDRPPPDDDLLAARYGRRPRGARPWYRRPLPLVAAALGTVLVLGYGLWVAVAQSSGPSSTAIGHEVLDDSSTRVRFTVTKDAGQAVSCTVHAVDAASSEVGLLRVDVPADQRTQVYEDVVVRTTSRAVTGEVVSCAAVEPDGSGG